MRYSKHPLIHLLGCCCLFIALWQTLGSCTDEAGGTDTPMPDKNIPLTIEITAEGFDGEADASPSTRYSESGNTTIFEASDIVGLFAVKNIGTPDAAIIDGIDNIQLKYIPAADASTPSVWEPVDATNILYYYADVTYVAYYPYKGGITIDPTQSAADICTSFSEMTELQPAADQSTEEAHLASDLMTASAKATDTDDPTKKHLLLNFTHSYSLLVLNAIDLSSKNFVSTDGAFDYIQPVTAPSPDLAATNAVLNGIKMLKEDNGVFRAIVKPTSGETPIKGSYITSSLLIGCDGSLPAPGLEAGKVHEWTMTATLPDKNEAVERALKPGDFVFQNNGKIEIYPGEGVVDAEGRIPNYANAIGIVVTCDPTRMTDTECNANGWTHAYVASKTNLNPGFGFRSWGPSNDETVIGKYPDNAEAKLNMDGYKETEAMLAERTKNGDIKSYFAFEELLTCRAKSPIPNGVKRSPWFLPSVGQCFDFLANLGGKSPDTYTEHNLTWKTGSKEEAKDIYPTIKKHFLKVDITFNTLFPWDWASFACTTQATPDKRWGFYISDTKVELIQTEKSQGYVYILPFFAF